MKRFLSGVGLDGRRCSRAAICLSVSLCLVVQWIAPLALSAISERGAEVALVHLAPCAFARRRS